MSELPPQIERQLKEAYGVTEVGPHVTFVDWALPDDEATKASGRPRFKDCVFIEKRNRGGVVKDVFRRRMEPQDKKDFPREWAEYEAKRGELANRAPPLWAIPGMSRAVYEELKALELTDCEKVAEYEGDLSEIESFRKVAKLIMEISHAQDRALRAQRENHREAVERQVHSVGTRPGAGGTFPGTSYSDNLYRSAPEIRKEKETFSEEKDNVTFAYNFNVA